MQLKFGRRSALKAGAALAAAAALPVSLETAAQAKPTLRFAAVFSDKDIRADMIRMLARDIEADFKLEPFYGGTLFKQARSSSRSSATTSRWATSRRRTSPSSFRRGPS